LVVSLQKDPLQGQALGINCFKIRMAISSKKKGKPTAGSRETPSTGYVPISQPEKVDLNPNI